VRTFLTVAVLLLGSLCASAQALKPCDELKAEIAKKLEAKNVSSYSLDIVAKDKEAEGKTVGTCEGGTKKIIYNKTPAPSRPPAEAKKP
jgi:hypothetical protein